MKKIFSFVMVVTLGFGLVAYTGGTLGKDERCAYPEVPQHHPCVVVKTPKPWVGVCKIYDAVRNTYKTIPCEQVK